MALTLDAVRAAAATAWPHLVRTPAVEVDGVHLKLECLQFAGSFKVRGYFAAAYAIPEAQREAGLLTVSAGNAAQACAFVAAKLGVPCRVVMPSTAPAVKLEGVRRWGGVPEQKERPEFVDWIERRGWEEEPETFIHPFENEDVMRGHGSLGLELLEDVPSLERVVVPVGGGGLIAGVAAAVKGLKPDVEVIGVQSDGYPLWERAFAAGGRVSLPVATIADGTTPPWSEPMHHLLPQVVDRWLLVPEPRLRAAIPELASRAKVVAEGAGALAYAALEQLEPGPVTAAVVSGGNIDPGLLAELLAG
jgi:threonine dehydratase